jgi:hypothetical protein
MIKRGIASAYRSAAEGDIQEIQAFASHARLVKYMTECLKAGQGSSRPPTLDLKQLWFPEAGGLADPLSCLLCDSWQILARLLKDIVAVVTQLYGAKPDQERVDVDRLAEATMLGRRERRRPGAGEWVCYHCTRR